MLQARKRKHTNSSLQMFFLNTARFVLVCVCVWLLAVVMEVVAFFVSSHGFSHRAVNGKIIGGSVDTWNSWEWNLLGAQNRDI